jgi:hypothetical protein
MATRKSAAPTHNRFRLVRDGFEFEAEGDSDFVLAMIKQFVSADSAKLVSPSRGTKLSDETIVKPTLTVKISDKATSVREFILQLESRKHTDLALAFGYYLEKYSSQPAFAPADINNLYYEAKLDTSNTSQMIIQNIKRGYMMEAKKPDNGGKKQYVLTNSGEKYIEDLLATAKT